MDRRIQQALDGELAREQLTPAERSELQECERALERVLAQVPEGGPAPDVTGQVMWRIAHVPAGARAGAGARSRLAVAAAPLRWLWRPRAFVLRPAWAVAALAVLALGVAGLGRREAAAPPAVAVESSGVNQLVQFRLGAEGVREVALVGDFGGWSVRYAMEEVAPGVWATALPLEPGVYDYAFVVDGSTWVLDPLAPRVSDGFGGANSRLSVLAPARRAST